MRGKPARRRRNLRKNSTVAPQETVQVGRNDFTTADGVTVEVRRDGVGYCVRGSNEGGHQTRWQCYDGNEDPSPRGFSF